jgi:4-hydroxy-3-methylbut-2-enyl diphosphate reductase
MKVIRSRVMGFCMGVRRAVSMAEEELNAARKFGGRVYALGPLIHNPKVLCDLKNRGMETLNDPIFPENQENCSIIVRAHGIKPQIEAELRGKGARIADATCPRVKASQLKAAELAASGYSLFLAGEADHAEVEGILGYTAGAFCRVVSGAEEAEAAAKKLREADKDARTALIGQTTISEEEYKAIGGAIQKYFPGLQIIQTICSATRDRQQALRELLTQVDAVIVIGGKDSANTRRLLAIAEESGKPCALAETAADIPKSFFNCDLVGLSAGASTPDSVIDELETFLAMGHKIGRAV